MSIKRGLHADEKSIVFCCWGFPWPGHSGAALRTQGLLKQISVTYQITFLCVTTKRITEQERNACLEHVDKLIEIPIRNHSLLDKLRLVYLILIRLYPYHPAIAVSSFKKTPAEGLVKRTSGPVYCTGSHFFAIADDSKDNKNWVIDQFDAEEDYWRLKARELRNPIKKLAARFNLLLTRRYCRKTYSRIGCVVSVSEEDKAITRSIAPSVNAVVIENGVDCDYFRPRPREREERLKRMLFTGPSNDRNLRAMEFFTNSILPRVNDRIVGLELVVAGDFNIDAQRRFANKPGIVFTGRVPDIRPFFDTCDVFVNPFEEAYGSKLKVAQALSMGICIVTTVNGAKGFLLEDGKTALIAGDEWDFANKLILALENKTLRDTIGENGREYAMNNLDWRVLGVKIRRVLAEIRSDTAATRNKACTTSQM